jgi:uncharacterized protein YndB with AHSA1/START domain
MSKSSHGVAIGADSVRFERLFPGPIERVWAYLAESDKRAQWLAAGEILPRVGAEAELRFHHASLSPAIVPTPEQFKAMENGISSHHRVTRYEPPTALGITWGDQDAPSQVLFELSAEGEQVRLTVTHTRLPGRGKMVMASSGWHTHLDILAERLAGHTPPAFWTVFNELQKEYAGRLDSDAPAAGN